MTDSSNRTTATLEFYAPYGSFDIVPMDVVDGPGHELLIFQVVTHSSPPIGYNLTIWKIDGGRSLPLLREPIQVAGLVGFGAGAMSCGEWKTSVDIDSAEQKPRSLHLRPEFTVEYGGPPCRVESDPQFAVRQQERMLRFQDRRYRFAR